MINQWLKRRRASATAGIAAGQMWELPPDTRNPFARERGGPKVRIERVKDGWVQYTFSDLSTGEMDGKTFRRFYRLVEQ